jgi:glycosyltransferase involved in cell wall biosynthesis
MCNPAALNQQLCEPANVVSQGARTRKLKITQSESNLLYPVAMKITFVLACLDLSGGNRVIATYADRLRQRGHEVSVIVPSPSLISRQQQLLRSFKTGQWIPRSQPSSSHVDALQVPYHQVSHPKPITDADVPDGDVVIATWWETAEWVANFSERKGAKAYFIQHHEVFEYQPIDRVQATYRLPLQKITISRWLVDLMADHYGDTHVTLVPNSVDTQQFYAPPREKQARPTVGMLYSVIPWKGCALSLSALQRVAQQFPDLHLVSFGVNHPTAELALPSSSEFHYRPPQAQIRDFYASCDVWLCSSENEGFCLPLLEAMACRTPIVSTPVGGSIDLVESGRNGILVPHREPEDLAKALIDVLSLSEQQWRSMSDAAYETATRYTWDDATDRFEAALIQAASVPSVP